MFFVVSKASCPPRTLSDIPPANKIDIVIGNFMLLSLVTLYLNIFRKKLAICRFD